MAILFGLVYERTTGAYQFKRVTLKTIEWNIRYYNKLYLLRVSYWTINKIPRQKLFDHYQTIWTLSDYLTTRRVSSFPTAHRQLATLRTNPQTELIQMTPASQIESETESDSSNC